MDISSMGGSAGLAAMQQALFQNLDTDKDGQISSTEFQAIGQALPGDGKKGAHKAQGSSGQGFGTETMGAMLSAQEDRFASSDTDGDGKLSAEEIAAGMADHAPPGASGDTTQMAANFVSKADTDGDGSISADEFKAAAPKHHSGHGGPPPAPAANDPSQTAQADAAKKTNPADTNGDGTVSAAEMLAYVQGAANDIASSMNSDASGKMQDLLAQLSKYGQSDSGTTAAKVA
jgi:Ca2+-binding EF-hand superfamily protein